MGFYIPLDWTHLHKKTTVISNNLLYFGPFFKEFWQWIFIKNEFVLIFCFQKSTQFSEKWDVYSGNVYIWVKITLTARVHTHAFPEITVSLAANLVEWGISSRRQICLLSVIALLHFQKTLTHWGRVTHICVSKLTIIGSDNGLSPDRRQAVILTNAEILLIGPLWTNFNETSIEIHTFFIKENPFETVVWKMAAILSRLQCVNRGLS